MFESRLFGQIVGMGGYDFGDPVGHIDPLDHYRRNIRKMSGQLEAKVDSGTPDEPSEIMPQYDTKKAIVPCNLNMDIWREFWGSRLTVIKRR
jgi:hypothetical protein